MDIPILFLVLFVLYLFHNTPMTRIELDALATHIEVALTCAPFDTFAALQDSDGQCRRRAIFTLAQHLADRIRCFEISGSNLGFDARHQESLFQEVPRAVS